jgi:predicted nuclease of predicted toxin-antitoxin system
MRFLIDESAERRIARHLWAAGHDVTSITHDYVRAATDREVLAIGVAERRLLVTNDEDFEILVFNFGLPHAGIILFRLGNVKVAEKITKVDTILTSFTDHHRTFFIVTPEAIISRQSLP